MKLTKYEKQALELCLNYDDRAAQLDDNMSTAGVEEMSAHFAERYGWNKQQVGGLISSLEKKGLGSIDDDGVNGQPLDLFWLSEKGVNAIFDALDLDHMKTFLVATGDLPANHDDDDDDNTPPPSPGKANVIFTEELEPNESRYLVDSLCDFGNEMTPAPGLKNAHRRDHFDVLVHAQKCVARSIGGHEGELAETGRNLYTKLADMEANQEWYATRRSFPKEKEGFSPVESCTGLGKTCTVSECVCGGLEWHAIEAEGRWQTTPLDPSGRYLQILEREAPGVDLPGARIQYALYNTRGDGMKAKIGGGQIFATLEAAMKYAAGYES